MPTIFNRQVREVGDVHLVTLGGELDLETAEGLSDWLVDISGSRVVVDLHDLTFMDSCGLSAFILTKNQLGEDFVVTRPQANVRRIFEITGLLSLLSDWDPTWSPSVSSPLGSDGQPQGG